MKNTTVVIIGGLAFIGAIVVFALYTLTDLDKVWLKRVLGFILGVFIGVLLFAKTDKGDNNNLT